MSILTKLRWQLPLSWTWICRVRFLTKFLALLSYLHFLQSLCMQRLRGIEMSQKGVNQLEGCLHQRKRNFELYGKNGTRAEIKIRDMGMLKGKNTRLSFSYSLRLKNCQYRLQVEQRPCDKNTKNVLFKKSSKLWLTAHNYIRSERTLGFVSPPPSEDRLNELRFPKTNCVE